MVDWNSSFTQLIRKSRTAHWGNWGLDPSIKPGAVGVVDPRSGNFTLVAETLPGISSGKLAAQGSEWKFSSEHVSQEKVNGSLSGSGKDPETGTDIKAGLKMSWSLEKAGSMISQFQIKGEEQLVDWANVIRNNLDWLAERAATVSMGSAGNISQGFGVVTSVIWANSGLNVAAQSDATTFAIEGSVSALNALVGEGEGKGSYTSSSSTKSVDQHLWPASPNTLSPEPVPIAFAFASFNGRLVMPFWTGLIGSFELILNNQHGGTYIVDSRLTYDTPVQKNCVQEVSTSGGLISTIGSIPLEATNLVLRSSFRGMFSNEEKSFQWPTPLGTWFRGSRHIDFTGVWPGQTGAIDAEAGAQA